MSQGPGASTLFTLGANITVSGNSGVLAVGPFSHLLVLANFTTVTGTTPSLTLSVSQVSPAGTVYNTALLSGAAITVAGQQALALGPGLPVTANASANVLLPASVQLGWVVSGTTPVFGGELVVLGRRS